tara:strand:- start:2218 stop:2859 length:642 start_codon:yes stop_codon:yes gene_type:complete
VKKTRSVNETLAKRFGWDYQFNNMNVIEGYKPAVCKIFETKTLLDTYKFQYDFIVFLDSDAWIFNPVTLDKMIKTLPDNKHGIFSRDPYLRKNTFINSGSFVIRINDFTCQMYDQIYEYVKKNDCNSWPWDQKPISDFVFKNRDKFLVYVPDVMNTPQGKVLRHSYGQLSFKTCSVKQKYTLLENLLEDDGAFPNKNEKGDEYLEEGKFDDRR